MKRTTKFFFITFSSGLHSSQHAVLLNCPNATNNNKYYTNIDFQFRIWYNLGRQQKRHLHNNLKKEAAGILRQSLLFYCSISVLSPRLSIISIRTMLPVIMLILQLLRRRLVLRIDQLAARRHLRDFL